MKDVLEKAPVGRKRAFKALCEPNFAVKVTLKGDDAARFPALQLGPLAERVEASGDRPRGCNRVGCHPLLAGSLCRQALELPSPRRARCVLPPEMLVALAADAAKNTIKLAKSRTEASRDLLRVCKGSVSRETALREGLDPEVNHVTSSKMSVALELLLREVGYVDPDVAESVRVGFPLVNWLPVSGLWDADVRPPELTASGLQRMSEEISQRCVKGLCRYRDRATERAVWAVTREEQASGWLSFCSREDLSALAVVSPRFGVFQKNKVRPIDNFKASLVNSACGVQEKVQMDGIDEIVEACLSWLRFRLPGSPPERILGRTWDLKSAYKQLAVRADHKHFAIICVMDPEADVVQYCRLHSLPFGAVAAVHAFLRCSEALKAIARKKFFIAMTSFFDDFTVLTSAANAAHVEVVVSSMFKKLGWRVATEEKKNRPFSEVFDVLGVRVDLSQQSVGVVQVSNTPQRVAELKDTVAAIKQKGSLTFEEAQRLRGRLVFAEQHVWGRNAKQAVVAVGDVSPASEASHPLTDVQQAALDFIEQRVLDGRPRSFSIQPSRTFHLWLDGACEWDVSNSVPTCGFGGVLWLDGVPLAWGDTLDAAAAQEWAGRVGKKQLVFECELLPYFISLQLWGRFLRNSDLLVFIDNDAARASLARSFTRKEEGAAIVFQAVGAEERLSINACFLRVPTSSNIADGPSRGVFDAILRLGGRRIPLPCGAIRSALGLSGAV